MNDDRKQSCPRCDHALVPVHAVEGTRRRVIALSCPAPYCDHMQRIPSGGTSGCSRAGARRVAP